MSASEDRALLELNVRRQTWCQVEGDPRQSWERADRKHDRSHRQTRSFAPLCPGERSTDRPAGGGGALAPVKHPEWRHFKESYERP